MATGGFFSNGGWSPSTGGSGGGGGNGGPSSGNWWSGGAPGGAPRAPAPTPPSTTSSDPGFLGRMLANQTSSPSYGPTAQGYNPQPEYAAKETANAYYGPQSVMTDQAQELNANRLGLLNFDQEYQTMAMKRDAGLARRKLELERGLAGGQLENVGKLKALAAEQLANQKADFANSRAKTIDQAKRQQWDLRSDLTQRGAFNTVANERGTGRIARDELYNLQSLNVQEQGADIGYRQGMVGYDNQTLQLQNQLAGIGLNGEKVAFDLENALHNSGIGYFGNFWSLMEASQSLNAQEAAIAGQVLQMVGGMAGLTPQMIEDLMGSMGQGGAGFSIPVRDR